MLVNRNICKYWLVLFIVLLILTWSIRLIIPIPQSFVPIIFLFIHDSHLSNRTHTWPSLETYIKGPKHVTEIFHISFRFKHLTQNKSFSFLCIIITKLKILAPSLGQSMVGHFKYVAGLNYGQTNTQIDVRAI